ncbi:molybdopterin-synthase adenylyltransferase MoeB [Tundrisphaera lichenicola]|uniref:molybdopterin-synthase adenylyltransferase MoeB n=1 Tax=Tundrisphaera lichenicola TaxID=2029860 RepID=UPI003EB99D4C
MNTLPFDLLGGRVGDTQLTADEIKRYARHLIMPEVAMEGQSRLKASKVLCIGAGGLGSPLTLYLAAAGVGTIGLVDFDVVDISNLQRQIIHATPDVGRPKIDSAEEKLKALNPDLAVVRYEFPINSENALDIFAGYDVIVDGTDNFPTRYLVNDACVLLGKPNVYGSIFRFDGQASVFFPPHGPCYRCLYPEPPPPDLVPNCAEGGVLGILPGVIGVIQATETVKLILGTGRTLIGRLLLYDALDMSFREMKVRKNPKCPICGPEPSIKSLIDYQEFCGIRGNETAPEVNLGAGESISPLELKELIENGSRPFVLDVRNPEEISICRIAGSTVIPLPELPNRLGELDPSIPMVVHCKSGVRSAKAISLLKSAGFTRLSNLTGGILAWIKDVEPSLPSY